MGYHSSIIASFAFRMHLCPGSEALAKICCQTEQSQKPQGFCQQRQNSKNRKGSKVNKTSNERYIANILKAGVSWLEHAEGINLGNQNQPYALLVGALCLNVELKKVKHLKQFSIIQSQVDWK